MKLLCSKYSVFYSFKSEGHKGKRASSVIARLLSEILSWPCLKVYNSFNNLRKYMAHYTSMTFKFCVEEAIGFRLETKLDIFLINFLKY